MTDKPASTPATGSDRSIATQSKSRLDDAEADGLLAYRLPVELRSPESLDRLHGELGDDIEVIADDGVYYWVFVNADDGTRQAVLIPEGDVRGFVLGLAAKAGAETVRRYAYRTGIVPK